MTPAARVIFALAAVSLLILAGRSWAATIRIPADHPTIQAGIDVAVTGDTVLVAPGNYNESLWYGFSGKDLVLRSEGGAGSTAIYAIDEGISFQAGEGPAAEVDGFTIRYGWVEHGMGGGIRIVNSSPTIKNCIVRDCTVITIETLAAVEC